MGKLPVGGKLIDVDELLEQLGIVPAFPLDLVYRDDLRSGEDGRRRPVTSFVPLQVNHTTKGIPGGRNKTPQTLRLGKGPDLRKDFAAANYWSTSAKSSGAHGIADADGSVLIIADLLDVAMYHAGNWWVNLRAVGWEMYQNGDASLWESTVKTQALLNLMTCVVLGQQFQICSVYKGRPVPRLLTKANDVTGIVGHHHCSSQRGEGDPGSRYIVEAAVELGAQAFDMYEGEDQEFWRPIQRGYGLVEDGFPGPLTHAALEADGYLFGIYALGKKAEQPPAPTLPDELDPIKVICKALRCCDDDRNTITVIERIVGEDGDPAEQLERVRRLLS